MIYDYEFDTFCPKSLVKIAPISVSIFGNILTTLTLLHGPARALLPALTAQHFDLRDLTHGQHDWCCSDGRQRLMTCLYATMPSENTLSIR